MKLNSKSINYNVQTVDELVSLDGLEGDTVVVTDEDRGGVFVYREDNVGTNNGGTIFNGWTRQYAGAVNVKWFGAKGDGVTDDTSVIQSVIDNFKRIYIPYGTYYVDVISISNSNNIITDKFNTIIQQKPQSSSSKPCIKITSSNVVLDDIYIKGNIATDTGEWNMAVQIQANSTYGALSNINCGNIKADNIRGDVVYISGTIGYDASSITIKNVIGNNILRNCVSITGGNGIIIGDIYSTNVGMLNLDIECESYNTPAQNITVGNIIGKGVNCVPSSALSYAENVYIKSVYLRPSLGGENSTPAYTSGGITQSGIILRNTKSISFGKVDIADYNNSGIFTIYNSGELGCELLSMDEFISSNCNVVDTTYKATITSGNLTNQNIFIKKANMVISDNKRGFLFGNISIGYINANLNSSGTLFTYSTFNTSIGAKVDGGTFSIGSKGTITNLIFSGNVLSSYAGTQAIHFLGSTITATTIANPSEQNNHTATGTTINGVYYSDGKLDAGWYASIALGSYRLWVNSSKLYIKSGIPTSGTDGTIVGTQS